ncbi:MAG: hypothetical protein IJP27_07770 [Clostridia bacterium]|nr:hypothetical protein [Clostridia bacterium]
MTMAGSNASIAVTVTMASKKKKAIFLPCIFEKTKRIAFIKKVIRAHSAFPKGKRSSFLGQLVWRPDTLDRENPFAGSGNKPRFFISLHGNDPLDSGFILFTAYYICIYLFFNPF